MIAWLKGKLLYKYDDRITVDVHGVGYEVFASEQTLATMPEEGQEVELHIHTHVREDAFVLFAFLERQEKDLFLLLKTVSGIGPKLALAMLSGMDSSMLCHAIAGKDIKMLVSLPGVGKKTAERICVELKDKVGDMAVAGAVKKPSMKSTISASVFADALSALKNFGYSDPVVRDALAKIKAEMQEQNISDIRLEVLIREGLKILSS